MYKMIVVLASFLLLTGVKAQSVTPAQSVVSDRNAEVRTIGSFHALKVSTGIHLYLVQGTENKVVVSASDTELRDRIRTEVKNGVLEIYFESKIWSWHEIVNRELRAYVSCTNLDGLTASSGAKVEVDGTLKSPNLAMSFSSGAKFKGRLEAGNLSVDGSSGAKADLSGTASALRAEGSSGSKLDGFDLQVQKCDVSVSSGAHIDLSVEKEMAVSAHSGGHVGYQGAGVITNVHTSSGGKVYRR